MPILALLLFLLVAISVSLGGLLHFILCVAQLNMLRRWSRQRLTRQNDASGFLGLLPVMILTGSAVVVPLLCISIPATFDDFLNRRPGAWQLAAFDLAACLIFLPLLGFKQKLARNGPVIAVLTIVSLALTVAGLLYAVWWGVHLT